MKILFITALAAISMTAPAYADNCAPHINRLFQIKNRLDSTPRSNRHEHSQLLDAFNQQKQVVWQCNQNKLANTPQDPFWYRQMNRGW
ncbi:hypothetical protein ABUK73_05440 [Agrobacterium sp. BA1120]|uniref:hypothetical protein n=1 Tax=Agrobacterium sp. BA1120 TaxID=3228927 RepID=UPI00336AAC14